MASFESVYVLLFFGTSVVINHLVLQNEVKTVGAPTTKEIKLRAYVERVIYCHGCSFSEVDRLLTLGHTVIDLTAFTCRKRRKSPFLEFRFTSSKFFPCLYSL